MNARSIASMVLVAALLGACAAAPAQEEPQEPQPELGLRIFVGVTEFLVTAAFDGAVSRHERRDHVRNSWAESAAPASYTVPRTHQPKASPKKPVSLKKPEGGR